jgi:hypothetical protein
MATPPQEGPLLDNATLQAAWDQAKQSLGVTASSGQISFRQLKAKQWDGWHGEGNPLLAETMGLYTVDINTDALLAILTTVQKRFDLSSLSNDILEKVLTIIFKHEMYHLDPSVTGLGAAACVQPCDPCQHLAMLMFSLWELCDLLNNSDPPLSASDRAVVQEIIDQLFSMIQEMDPSYSDCTSGGYATGSPGPPNWNLPGSFPASPCDIEGPQ